MPAIPQGLKAMPMSVRFRSSHRLLAGSALVLALTLSGCGQKRPKTLGADIAASRVTQIGVNAYLWRAALDTVSFMPLAQVDSNGGVIVTDWYANPATPGERMKLTVSILDQDLRADAIRVAASRQVMAGGQWADAPVAAQTVQRLEEIILGRARDLRRGTVSSG
jgi:predicted small lipoprotein YifL